jgi:heat shock protein HslJ
MPSLTEILSEAAGPASVPFTSADIRHRVTRRHQSRRRARLASAAAVLTLTALTTAVAVRSNGGDDSGDDVAMASDSAADQILGQWELVGLSLPAMADEPVFIRFEADGTFRGRACNWFGSYTPDEPWSVDGDKLVVGDAALTAMACGGAMGAVEEFFWAVLDSGPTIAGEAGEAGGPWRMLRLTAPDGSLLSFARSVPVEEGPTIGGVLLDGRTWAVTDSAEHGLCVVLGDNDLGCDDAGPVIPPGADPATPRTAADESGSAFPEEDAGALLYGHLPPGATMVVVTYDDGSEEGNQRFVVQGEPDLWALPIELGNTPAFVVYIEGNGTEVARFPVGGG